MTFRKFKSDSLFTGSAFAPAGKVLITDDEGTIVDIIPVTEAGDDVENFKGTIMPGFINAHCHLELSHMKGKIPAGTGLVNFLIKVIRERGAEIEIIREAMRLAENEMKVAGIVGVGDTCNTPFTIDVKRESEIRWRNFIEVIGFTELNARQRLLDGEKTLQTFREPVQTTEDSNSAFKSSLTPHAPYSVSPGLFQLINAHSAGERISIHNQEANAERDLFLNGSGEMFTLYQNLNIDPSFFDPTGKSSLESYVPLLNKSSGIILVHNTYITEQDIRFAISQEELKKVYFCLCPNANKYIESVFPPAEMIRKLGGTIVLGTDSYASNWQLNILEEIKLLHEGFPKIPLAEKLQWATLNGAKALEMDDKLGSFETGKKPAVVLIEGMNEEELASNAIARRIL